MSHLRRPAARPPVGLTHFVDRLPVPLRRGVPRFSARQRFAEHAPRFVLKPDRELVHGLVLALEFKPEVVHPPLKGQRCLFVLAIKHQAGRTRRRVFANECVWNVRPLNRGARIAIWIGEVAQRATDRTPAAGDTGLRHTCVVAVHRVLINHQIERLNPGE